MELRQLRYFVKAVELGSMGRAALELGVVASALSQQISRLESEIATRLLQRTSTGVLPTQAGLAFLHQAQLALRHVDGAVQAAQQARLSGVVSVGMAPTTVAVLAVPFMQAMRDRYPDVRVHLVESLSGHLAGMLNARLLDLAVVFHAESARRWSVMPLLDEQLFLIARPGYADFPVGKPVRLRQLAHLPLLLPSKSHGLRSLVDTAFARARCEPTIAAEVDGLAVLMDLVRAGYGASIQPGAATARAQAEQLAHWPISDRHLRRSNLLVSLSDDELSPAGLAARLVLSDLAVSMVREGRWPGARLHET